MILTKGWQFCSFYQMLRLKDLLANEAVKMQPQ